MSIITQQQPITPPCLPLDKGRLGGVSAGVDSGLSIDIIRSYKQEFYNLYGELITVAMATGCKHLIPDNATSRIISLRLADEIGGSSDIADWMGITAMMLDIQRNAEASDGDCCEIYHRAEYLASRAQAIAQKMRR